MLTVYNRYDIMKLLTLYFLVFYEIDLPWDKLDSCPIR